MSLHAASEAARPFVSIVIPTRNEARHIGECLDAILAGSYPPHRLEIIIADAGSTDATRDIIAGYQARDARIRLVENPGRSAGAGLNAAIAHARGDIILRVDGHTLVAPDYVERCVERLAGDEGLGNVGGPQNPIGEGLFGEAIALALRSPFSMGGSPFRYTVQPRYLDTVYLGAFRRPVLERLGGFDPRLPANEDYELNYRLRRAGFRILCDPAIRSKTYTRRDVLGLARQYLRYGYGKACVLAKHPRSIAGRQLLALLLMVAYLGSAGLALAGHPVPLLGITMAYLAGNVGASAAAGMGRAGRPGWLIPLVFLIMHVCWGLSLMAGLLFRLPAQLIQSLRSGH